MEKLHNDQKGLVTKLTDLFKGLPTVEVDEMVREAKSQLTAESKQNDQKNLFDAQIYF